MNEATFLVLIKQIREDFTWVFLSLVSQKAKQLVSYRRSAVIAVLDFGSLRRHMGHI